MDYSHAPAFNKARLDERREIERAAESLGKDGAMQRALLEISEQIRTYRVDERVRFPDNTHRMIEGLTEAMAFMLSETILEAVGFNPKNHHAVAATCSALFMYEMHRLAKRMQEVSENGGEGTYCAPIKDGKPTDYDFRDDMKA